MKGNLEAKFYSLILEATQSEFPEIVTVRFEVDPNIDNPSNKDVIDCITYFKEFNKSTKKATKQS